VGQYTFHIRELHEKHGPIVRINPWEVHIADADYYDEVYAGPSKQRDKWERFYKPFGIPESTFATVKHEHHRIRRAPLNPFFSKAKVRALQPQIEEVLGNFLKRVDEFQGNGEVMSVDLAFAAYTAGMTFSFPAQCKCTAVITNGALWL
jgi:cytochrome P450